MSKYLALYGVKAEIQTGGTTTPVWSEIGAGIENIDEALNEVVYSGFFLKDKGFGTSQVTGMQPVVSFSGKRVYDDEAQDYIFDKTRKYGFGDKRETNFKLTVVNGATTTTITCPVTIAGIQEYSGGAQDLSSISFELRFNGAPTIE